jgi:predicted acylesterase/phospholipase RssA
MKETVVPAKRDGVALIITGAAARIPQEAALLEELQRRGLLKDLVFISGVSSGALNSVMINGILSRRMSWGEYKNILFNLQTKDIFISSGNKKLPFDTSPARELYTKVVEGKLRYYKIGDLPFTTALSVTYPKHLDLQGVVYRMCSRKINEESDTNLNLVDIMMASSAFPLAFPPARIRDVTTIPDVEYIDGGAGEDILPYHALLEFEKHRGFGVERVYIISRKSDSIPEVSEELKRLGIDDKGIFDRLGFSLDALLNRGIKKRLEEFTADAPELVPLTYVWIPEFKGDFLLLNFDNLKSQYSLTSQWARTHNPVPLNDFLERYRKESKRFPQLDSLDILRLGDGLRIIKSKEVKSKENKYLF